MSERNNRLMAQLEKSRAEFDIATKCVIEALQTLHERIDRIEKWILENQKKSQE